MTPVTIRRRILLAIVVPAIALLAAFSVLVYLRVSDHRLADLDRELRVRAVGFAGLVERDGGRWLFEDDAAPLASRRLMEGLAGWTVVLPDGRTLVGEGVATPWRPEDAAPNLSPGVRTVEAYGHRLRVWTGPLTVPVENEPDDTPVVVTVGVAKDLATLTTELHLLLATLGVVGVALALVGAAVGVVLSGRIVAALDDIAGRAEAVRPGSPPPPMPRNGTGDEVDRLADTLDAAFARAHQAWERQARFTGDASHELRTPLSVIRAAVEVALRRERTVDHYRDALGIVAESAARMQDTVEGLLLLARAEAGALGDGWSPLDLDVVAADACTGWAARAEARGVALQVDDDGPAPVDGHPALLRVVVDNLLSNALRHAPVGSTVTVRTTCIDDAVVLAVRDGGPGIPTHALDRVFDRFYRVDDARSRESGGAGLGLAVVQAIATVHGGTAAAAGAPGGGTEVRIVLPRRSASAQVGLDTPEG
ncbi:MAG: HAMP domain-containing histidine kinase [Alphaproteobacteria bacterium]|nr:HAMP domain-containing histidine kinase [Alphaproteobacteria bacterium]